MKNGWRSRRPKLHQREHYLPKDDIAWKASGKGDRVRSFVRAGRFTATWKRPRNRWSLRPLFLEHRRAFRVARAVVVSSPNRRSVGGRRPGRFSLR